MQNQFKFSEYILVGKTVVGSIYKYLMKNLVAYWELQEKYNFWEQLLGWNSKDDGYSRKDWNKEVMIVYEGQRVFFSIFLLVMDFKGYFFFKIYKFLDTKKRVIKQSNVGENYVE